MIQKLNSGSIFIQPQKIQAKPMQTASKNMATAPSFAGNYTATSLVNAYQAFYGIDIILQIHEEGEENGDHS